MRRFCGLRRRRVWQATVARAACRLFYWWATKVPALWAVGRAAGHWFRRF